jgi:2-methylcitrate dehydratase PrpD
MSESIETIAAGRMLAEGLAEVRFEDLLSPVREDARRSVLDWLGSALAGSLEPPARMARQAASSWGTASGATMFGAGPASAAAAAFANGVASHILELDDVHKGSTLHAGAPVISAALAAAERARADGRAFLTAVVVGYECALRIGEAVNPSHYRFWHPTGTCATFGAAAAAASIMRLSPRSFLHALGSAGTQAAGLWEFNSDGTMSKHLHPGKAAFNGLLSADLAAVGFTGAASILEGERGFLRAMSAGADARRLTVGLGATWKISENCYKLHACCGHTHSAIDAAIALVAEHGWSRDDLLERVATIHIETYGPGYDIVKQMNPCTPYQAKFSLAYCVGAALVERRVGLDQFTEDRFAPSGVVHPAIRSLLERTRITVDRVFTEKYPAAWPGRVNLIMRDGTSASREYEYPRGNPENPVSTEMLEEKFVSLVSPRVGRAVAESALEATRCIDRWNDMSTLFHHLGRFPDADENQPAAAASTAMHGE